MTATQDLRAVIDSGMCIACGACCAADRSLSLSLDPERQIYQPTGVGAAEAASVCPAIEVDYEALHDFVFDRPATGPLGLIDSVFLAQSTDEGRNRRASSGGLIKEVIRYLLASDTVDGVISIAHDEGLEYPARLIRAPDEVDLLPGSIYHNINLQSALDLIESEDKRLGLVAIPCQLEGIYNYISKRRPGLRQRVVFSVGLICAWQYTRHSIQAMARYEGVDPETISDVSYRGGDMIGKLRLQIGQQKELEIDRRSSLNYQIAFDRYFNTPRCNVCVNHLNFLADLVVGDSWIQSTRFSRTGISIALARTNAATDALLDMQKRGQVVVHQVSEEELIESEGESLVFGEFAYSFADYLRSRGLHAPRLRGPNRGYGKPKAIHEIASFHRKLSRRQRLMAQGRYRTIWWRKVLLEGHRILFRYLRWFVNRALRLKRLTGRDRRLDRDELMAKFR